MSEPEADPATDEQAAYLRLWIPTAERFRNLRRAELIAGYCNTCSEIVTAVSGEFTAADGKWETFCVPASVPYGPDFPDLAPWSDDDPEWYVDTPRSNDGPLPDVVGHPYDWPSRFQSRSRKRVGAG